MATLSESKNKNLLQRVSLVLSRVFVLFAFVLIVCTLSISNEQHPVLKPSLGAATFFFFTLGLVLRALGTANLPNLKIDD